MSGDFVLCKACKGFNFSHLGPSSHDTYPLGTAADIALRRSCVFCSFIQTHFLTGDTPVFGQETRYPSAVKISLRRDGLGSVQSNATDEAEETEIVSIRIAATKSWGAHVDLLSCTLPVPSVQDYCDATSPYLARKDLTFSTRRMEPTVSPDLPRKWLQLCRSEHGDRCENPSWIQSHENPANIRLVDVQEMCVVDAAQHCEYICLSYVWGEIPLSRRVQAVSGNINDLQRCGSLGELEIPRTILDAIRFVRDMGERFLWVDCLCILQDDDREKSIQINQMDLIYARALLTIAVVAGDDCDSGIPHFYRQTRKLQQEYVQISSERGWMVHNYSGYFEKEEKWATRGWTYQELHLSRRVLLVMKERVHWRCECDYWNENTCLEPPRAFSGTRKSLLARSLGLTFFRPRFDPVCLSIHTFYYNRDRDFKNDGDALDAIKGVLKRMEHTSNTRYHWALPCRNFHASLLWGQQSAWWQKNRPRKGVCKLLSREGEMYTTMLPSWSWVGWFIALHYPIYSEKEAQELVGKEMSRNRINWAAEWFLLDTRGNMLPIEQNPQGFIPSDTILWAGSPLERTEQDGTIWGNDVGRIVARTSYARCRLRAQLYDDITRRSGGEPIDSHKYDLLDSAGKVVGPAHSIDLVSPAEYYDEARLADERDNGCVWDLVVISRQKGWAPATNEDDNDLPVLNLMMVKWDAPDNTVASRLGILQMPEWCWITTTPSWRQVILH